MVCAEEDKWLCVKLHEHARSLLSADLADYFVRWHWVEWNLCPSFNCVPDIAVSFRVLVELPFSQLDFAHKRSFVCFCYYSIITGFSPKAALLAKIFEKVL